MRLATLAGALLQIAAVTAAGWATAALTVERLLARRPGANGAGGEIGLPERWLLALLGSVTFAVALMIGHIVTGGVVFGLPGAVPLVTAALLIAARRSFAFSLPRRRAALVWIVAVPLAVIYIAPVILGGSSIRIGDPPWHLGWTQQLLGGEPVPTGPAPELGRNAYPWGFHALTATMVRLVPGSDPMVALEALHMMLVFAIPLAAACLARRVRREAGIAAAGLAGLVGGFGWIAARGPAFSPSPGSARFGADLVAASPNSAYELFPPALPREIALVVLAAAALLLVMALERADDRLALVAGAAWGVVGLISVPLFVTALVWGLGAAVAMRGGRRLVARCVGTALLVFLLWAGPVLSDALRYGGFVDITPRLGREWSLPESLWSWGLLLPASVAGLAYAWRARSRASFVLVSFFAGSAVLLVLSLARRALDWGLAGNATLLHQGRVWPAAHLVAAALGGIAVVALYGALARRARLAAVAVVGGLFAVGAASPTLAAFELHDVITNRTEGFVYSSDYLAPGSFLRRAAARLRTDDVVLGRGIGGREIPFFLFQLAGARVARYDDPRLAGNDLRIRFAELARRWDQRVAGDGFEPDYIVELASRAPPGAVVLEEGVYKGRRYVFRAPTPSGQNPVT